MTRKEAIVYLKHADVTVGKEIQTKTAEALDLAIKALEQETVSKESYDHEYFLRKELEMNIEKIRAEIEEHAKINQNLNTDRARALCWCLDVIDKYKA